MKISIHVIIDELSDMNPVYHFVEKDLFHTVTEKTEMIAGKKLLTELPDQFISNILYILEESLFEQIPDPERLDSFFLVSGNSFYQEHGLKNLPEHVLFVDAAYSMCALSNKMDEIFFRYSEWSERMDEAILSRINLKRFMGICEEMLPNPVYILDAVYTVVYISKNIPEKIEGTILEYILPSYYFDYTGGNYGNIDYSEEKYLNLRHVYKGDAVNSFLSYNLFPDQIRYGELTMLDTNTPLTRGQMDLLEYVGQKLTVFMETYGYRPLDGKSINYMLLELLNGKTISRDHIRNYLKRLGWKLQDIFRIICFYGTDPERQKESYFRIVIPRIKKIIPYSVMVFLDNCLVCVVRDNDRLQLNEVTEKVLEKYLDDVGLKCAISVIFDDFMKCKLYYEQTKMILKMEKINSVISRVLKFEDVYFDCMMAKFGEEYELDVLCDPKIFKLIEYDQKKKGNLYETLFVYLSEYKSLVRTAERLYVHKNTVLQRLERIRDISGIEIDRSDYEEYLLFSCKVQNYKNRKL